MDTKIHLGENANRVARQWAELITRAFSTGEYRHENYSAAFQPVWRKVTWRTFFRLYIFLSDWLNANCKENGTWDLRSQAKDKIYFQLSDDWRKRADREADCTWRIQRLMDFLDLIIENVNVLLNSVA